MVDVAILDDNSVTSSTLELGLPSETIEELIRSMLLVKIVDVILITETVDREALGFKTTVVEFFTKSKD